MPWRRTSVLIRGSALPFTIAWLFLKENRGKVQTGENRGKVQTGVSGDRGSRRPYHLGLELLPIQEELAPPHPAQRERERECVCVVRERGIQDETRRKAVTPQLTHLVRLATRISSSSSVPRPLLPGACSLVRVVEVDGLRYGVVAVRGGLQG